MCLCVAHQFLCASNICTTLNSLSTNDLSGPIDALASLTNLRFVDLSSNKMTGSLMDASNWTQLESFNVAGNKLSGTVPESFSGIYSLGMYVYLVATFNNPESGQSSTFLISYTLSM